jgi:hypothetical protein
MFGDLTFANCICRLPVQYFAYVHCSAAILVNTLSSSRQHFVFILSNILPHSGPVLVVLLFINILL